MRSLLAVAIVAAAQASPATPAAALEALSPEPPQAPCRLEGETLDHPLPLTTANGVTLGSVVGTVKASVQLQPGTSPAVVQVGKLHLEVGVPTDRLRLSLAAPLAFDPVVSLEAGTAVLVDPNVPSRLLIDPASLADYRPSKAHLASPLSCGGAVLAAGGSAKAEPAGATLMRLNPARIAISATPGGKAEGTIARGQDRRVWVIGSSGKWSQIEIRRGTMVLKGWIASTALDSRGAAEVAPAPVPTRRDTAVWRTCSGTVEVWAKAKGKAAERVGWFDAGAKIAVGAAVGDLTIVETAWARWVAPGVVVLVPTAALSSCR